MSWGEPGVLPQPDHTCTALAVNLADEDGTLLAGILRGSNWSVKQVGTCQQAIAHARNQAVPVMLCERQMRDGNWKALLGGLREGSSPPALIVVSRLADERLWAEVLNIGGYDVLLTPFDSSELFRVLFLAWSDWERERTSEKRTDAGSRKPPAVELTRRGVEPELQKSI